MVYGTTPLTSIYLMKILEYIWITKEDQKKGKEKNKKKTKVIINLLQ